jgi:hypothetical protein
MFCPNCRAEYRPGFAQCSDCEVDLVEVLPPQDPQASELDEYERPDLADTPYFLAWFIPMCISLILFFGVLVRPSLVQNIRVLLFILPLTLFSASGSFWMIFQAVRHERRIGKYVLLSFVPFMFVWYSLVRVPHRKEFQGKSDFIH